MLKLSKSVQKIKKVCSNNEITFYLTQNNKIYQDEILIFEGQGISDIRICKNDFYAFGDSIHNYLGDFRNKTVSEIDFMFSSECIWRNGAITNENYRYDTSDRKVKADYFILDFGTKQKRILFRDLQGRITCLFDDNKKAIYSFKTTLRSLSLITGEYEWEVDLGEKLGTYDSIAKIVGVVDEVLWVISQRGILFGIEINTGELLYHLNYDNVESFKEIGNVSAKYFYSLFDEANKKLIGIYRNQCWEIDLTKPTTGLQVFDLEAINPTYFSHPDFYFRGSYWAAPEGVIFDNDYIYFRDIEVATVGIMHRQTKKIEWHTRLNDQEPMVRDVINDIQVSDNKLYVLDSGGTLHIFEKEEVA